MLIVWNCRRNAVELHDLSNMKVLRQRDLGKEFEDGKWLKILADCGKYVKKGKDEFTV